MRAELRSTLFGLLAIGLSSGPGISLANNSCTHFLAEKAKQGAGGWYAIELTIHREDMSSVSYGGDTVGWLLPKSDGTFVGHSDQLFSERMSEEAQPFAFNYSDDINLKLEPNGRLYVYSSNPAVPNAAWDLSCKGKLLTTYVPNFGVVTLSFRDLYK